jgi:hypothetical protein
MSDAERVAEDIEEQLQADVPPSLLPFVEFAQRYPLLTAVSCAAAGAALAMLARPKAALPSKD